MILADTSVWIEHLRRGHRRLEALLLEDRVLQHAFVVGELACGDLRDRETTLRLLQALPLAPMADHDEVLQLLESRKLHGSGLGWIDAHLLASALLGRCSVWTFDSPLRRAAERLAVAASTDVT